MRRAEVYMGDRLAGILEEGEEGFTFTYAYSYRAQRYPDNIPVTKTMPVREAPGTGHYYTLSGIEVRILSA